MYVWTDENGTLRTHYQFQSTPRNITNLFKMADGRFPLLSSILGLISKLPIACFQVNLALLILRPDYSRRRQNIVRLLTLPVSRGGRNVGSPFSLTLGAFLWDDPDQDHSNHGRS